MERQGIPFGDMLPGLNRWHSNRIPSTLLRTRSYNALVRSGVVTWGDLADLTTERLFELRGVGWRSAKDIVIASIGQSLTVFSASDAGDGPPPVEGGGVCDEQLQHVDLETSQVTPGIAVARDSDASDVRVTEMVAGLRTLAAWGARERDATELRDVINLNSDAGSLPADLAELWRQCSQINLAALADSVLLNVTLDDLAQRIIACMDERQLMVYRRRMIDGATLAVVGKELGVTRERVRQLQGEAEERISHQLSQREFSLLHWRAADLRSALGAIAPATSENTCLALEKSLHGAGLEAARLLRPIILRLAGPYRVRHGWMVFEHADIPEGSDLEAMADECGLLPLDYAYGWLARFGVRHEFHDAWLDQSGRFRRNGEFLMVWTGSVVDKCVALLASESEPIDADTLVSMVGEGHNVRGVRARFFEDDRLARTNRTEWALRAWGMEEYTGITDEIAQRINNAGGQVEIDLVVRELVEQFGVKENSIRAYATAPMFVVEGDRIRLRRDDEQFEVGGTFQRCVGAYRSTAKKISLVVPADAELLRGSGRPLSGPVAAALGLAPGRPRSFSNVDGALNVTWPMTSATGPILGSLRVMATATGAIEGERVRLDFDLAQGCVSVERIPRELDGYDATEAIRLLTGIAVDHDNSLKVIATAIDTSPIDVRGVLVQRGDADLAGLLPIPEVDQDLESVLLDLAKVVSQR